MPNRTDKLRDRLALRASTTFILRSMDLLARIVGGNDLLRGVIFLAIVDANVRHIRPGDDLGQIYSEAGDSMPDDLRRPISIHALALGLEQPYETTRRHVNRLMADGICLRGEGGVYVPAAVLARDDVMIALKRNYENLHELFGDLHAGGVEFSPGQSLMRM